VPAETGSRKIGLARALSKLGYCSRSRATELICAGQVRLNAKLSRDPEAPVRLELDTIEVDGRAVESERKVYLAMNKPRGLVTTADDEKGRETVYSILHHSEENLPWVAPVGRLDKASEGLLLFTNDSEWAARVAAPETHLEKTYHVQIGTLADTNFIRTVTRGVRTKDGDFLTATSCSLLRTGEKNCWLEITLDEGKNRQIRRLIKTLSVEVLRLVRVAIGPLELGTLPKGTYRHLRPDERQSIDHAMLAKQRKPQPRDTSA